MIFKENDIQIEVTKVDVPSGVMIDTIMNNGVHIIQCKTDEDKTVITSLKTDEKEYCSEKDIRRNYSGKTFIIKGIKYLTETNNVVLCEENPDSYVMISKRDIKEQFPELKRGLSIDTERWGIAVIERVIQFINSWLKGNTYYVAITMGDKVQEISPIFADNSEEMKETIIMYVIDGNEELFDVIERVTV